MNSSTQNDFLNKTNVASSFLNSQVIFSSDEFFAAANRMLSPKEAVFIDDKFDDNGKWMDGWETRRRRDGKNDFCLLKLGQTSIIDDFDIDTSHFTGNYAPAISVMGCCIDDKMDDQSVINGMDDFSWQELLSPQSLQGDHHNIFNAVNRQQVSHLKITLYPDGGIARFRAYGSICFNQNLYQQQNINVIAAGTGAKAIYANNEHFGQLDNILSEHTPLNMADGWETRRRREPGNDWGIIALARPATVNSIIVDTKFFKGNFPESFSICAVYAEKSTDQAIICQSMFWHELISRQPLAMDKEHLFSNDSLQQHKPITHIRLNIFPDGGISRLKLLGQFIKEQ